MQAEPHKEHAWFKQLVGDWTMEGEALMGPDQPPMKSKGFETVSMLGEFWMVADGEAEMPGGHKGKMTMTLGYDPRKKRYVGTWVGSMMDLLFVYDGKLDATKKILTLTTEGPSFKNPKKMAKFQDIITIKSKDHRTLTSRVQGDDGKWTQFMTAHYRRKKK